jgi:hypothetical protein
MKHKYVDRDNEGNITGYYAYKHEHHTDDDKISEEDLKAELQSQELQ